MYIHAVSGWERWGLEPWGYPGRNFQGPALNLAGRHFDPRVLRKILTGFFIGAFGRCSAEHPRQSRRVRSFQGQGGIGRAMALPIFNIIIASEGHPSKEALGLERLATGKALSRTRLEGSIDLIDQRLQHGLEQLRSALKKHFAELDLQFGQFLFFGHLVEEALDQARGFLLESRLEFSAFFFASGWSFARVMATVVFTNSSAKASNSLRPWMALASGAAFSRGTRRVLFLPSSQAWCLK
jgi:hypothetical protein